MVGRPSDPLLVAMKPWSHWRAVSGKNTPAVPRMARPYCKPGPGRRRLEVRRGYLPAGCVGRKCSGEASRPGREAAGTGRIHVEELLESFSLSERAKSLGSPLLHGAGLLTREALLLPGVGMHVG